MFMLLSMYCKFVEQYQKLAKATKQAKYVAGNMQILILE